MQICNYCLLPIVGVMSLSKEGDGKFSQCGNYYMRTKQKKMKEPDLLFVDVLIKTAEESGKYNL